MRQPQPFDATAFDPPASDPWLADAELVHGAGRRVLIVDDEPLLAERMCALLGDQFEAEFALTGEEAIDLLRSGRRFAAVLSDQEMPGMDGTALLAQIQEEFPEVVRILFTGLYDMGIAARALSEGRIFRFLMKPCSGDEVAVALEAGILHHRKKVTRRLAEERYRFTHETVQGFNHVLEERLDQAQYSVVFALARLAEERDNCTGNHLERVSGFCRELAIGLAETGNYEQIDERFVRDIERCAPLHDIGKVGIPDSILLKPGRLTEDEWEVMRTHSTIGAETLGAIIRAHPGSSFLAMGREVALCHHENWDGSGYCQGLSGESIPLSARILKVADCYDALTTWRPYKEAWSHDRAIELVLSEAGRQFDPSVIEVLVDRQRRFDRLRRALSDENQLA